MHQVPAKHRLAHHGAALFVLHQPGRPLALVSLARDHPRSFLKERHQRVALLGKPPDERLVLFHFLVDADKIHPQEAFPDFVSGKPPKPPPVNQHHDNPHCQEPMQVSL